MGTWNFREYHTLLFERGYGDERVGVQMDVADDPEFKRKLDSSDGLAREAWKESLRRMRAKYGPDPKDRKNIKPGEELVMPDAPAKKQQAKKKGVPGLSACALIRYLSHKKTPYLTLRQVVARMGFPAAGMSDSTFKIQMRKGQKEPQSLPRELEEKVAAVVAEVSRS